MPWRLYCARSLLHTEKLVRVSCQPHSLVCCYQFHLQPCRNIGHRFCRWLLVIFPIHYHCDVGSEIIFFHHYSTITGVYSRQIKTARFKSVIQNLNCKAPRGIRVISVFVPDYCYLLLFVNHWLDFFTNPVSEVLCLLLRPGTCVPIMHQTYRAVSKTGYQQRAETDWKQDTV